MHFPPFPHSFLHDLLFDRPRSPILPFSQLVGSICEVCLFFIFYRVLNICVFVFILICEVFFVWIGLRWMFPVSVCSDGCGIFFNFLWFFKYLWFLNDRIEDLLVLLLECSIWFGLFCFQWWRCFGWTNWWSLLKFCHSLGATQVGYDLNGDLLTLPTKLSHARVFHDAH